MNNELTPKEIREITGISITGFDLNEKLRKIAKEEYGLEFDSMRFTVAFDKETDEEKVIEDARSLFQALKTGEGMTPLFTVGVDENGNHYSWESEEYKKSKEVTHEESESIKKFNEVIKNHIKG